MPKPMIAAVAGVLGMAASTQAAVTYLTQDRSISAMTSFDGAVESAVSTDFAEFVRTIDLMTTFPTPAGGTAVNRAFAGIDCHLDPNRILLIGTLSGAGGISLLPDGTQAAEFGNAFIVTDIAFQLDSAAAFSLSAVARPSADPRDEFKIKLARLDGGGDVILFIDETSPPQAVALETVLQPGLYAIEYEAELTVAGDGATGAAGFEFVQLPPPAICVGDANGDDVIGFPDVTAVLSHWGFSYAPGTGRGDSDGNGVVDFADITAVLNHFGLLCP